jgi:hypothetical protein
MTNSQILAHPLRCVAKSFSYRLSLTCPSLHRDPKQLKLEESSATADSFATTALNARDEFAV